MCENPNCPNCISCADDQIRKSIFKADPTTIDGLLPNQIEASRMLYFIIKDQLEMARKYYNEFKDKELSMVMFENDREKVEEMLEEIKCNTIDMFEFSSFYERFNNFVHTLHRFSKDGIDMYFDLPRYILNDDIRSHKSIEIPITVY